VPTEQRLFRTDLAAAHDRAFVHADNCAPGILALLKPIRARDGLVLEIGCGSVLLTRHLLNAGHRVIASDASPAMLDIARAKLRKALDICQLTLPDDPLRPADAIVGVGHPLSYLPDHASVRTALTALAHTLRPGGILAV
jgi:SAM-dependent methyltransferase